MSIRLRRPAVWALAIAALLAARTARAQDTMPAPADTTAEGAPPVAPPAPAREPEDVSFPAPGVRVWQVGLLRPDRMQHASISMTLALGVGVVTRDAKAGFVTSVAFGLAKELLDMRSTHFDAIDLTADVIGAGVGAFATHAVEY